MHHFKDDFAGFYKHTAKLARAVSIQNRIRQAIHNKDKFEILVQNLSHFISKLNNIMPAKDSSLGKMIQHDLRGLRLKLLQKVLATSKGWEALMADSAEKAIEKSCSDRILNRFWYRVMEDRQRSLLALHARTL